MWARAQGLEAEPDSFGGFRLSMLAVHLADKGTLVCALTAGFLATTAVTVATSRL